MWNKSEPIDVLHKFKYCIFFGWPDQQILNVGDQRIIPNITLFPDFNLFIIYLFNFSNFHQKRYTCLTRIKKYYSAQKWDNNYLKLQEFRCPWSIAIQFVIQKKQYHLCKKKQISESYKIISHICLLGTWLGTCPT